MSKLLLLITINLSIMGIFSGCEERSKTDAVKIHWDRDMCERCVMVISDRKNTTQVRNPKTGKSYLFDDIGCTLLWFKNKKIEWKEEAIIWITDIDTGKWIDARKAFYDADNVTPMGYGFSAHKEKSAIKKGKEVLDFKVISQRILAKG